jgi:hypothetical protein
MILANGILWLKTVGMSAIHKTYPSNPSNHSTRRPHERGCSVWVVHRQILYGNLSICMEDALTGGTARSWEGLYSLSLFGLLAPTLV